MKTVVMYTAFDYNDNPTTGGTRRFLEILYGLLDKGDTVHLYIPEKANIKEYKNLVRHCIKNKHHAFIPDGLLNFIFNFKTLCSIKKINYDSLIIIEVPYAIQVVLLNLKKIKFLVRKDFIGYKKISLEGKKIPLILKRILLHMLTFLERLVLLKVDIVIVQCDYDKQTILNRHKKYKSKIDSKFKILFNNVNPNWIEAKSSLLTCKHNSGNDFKRLIFIGNINDKRKGLHLLIEAVKKLFYENYNFKLTVIGGGGLLNQYKEECKSCSGIEWLGFVADPLPILVNCDLLIVPSLADSFPNTVMEALFFDVAVIGSRTGGIPEMLKYNDLLFDPNVESLFEKLKAILDNNSLPRLQKLGRKRKERLSFDWVSELKEMVDE